MFLFLPVEYSDLKKDPQHYCEVRAEIKGLEKKLLGKANAEINLDLTERYLNGHCMYVSGHLTLYRRGCTKITWETAFLVVKGFNSALLVPHKNADQKF